MSLLQDPARDGNPLPYSVEDPDSDNEVQKTPVAHETSVAVISSPLATLDSGNDASRRTLETEKGVTRGAMIKKRSEIDKETIKIVKTEKTIHPDGRIQISKEKQEYKRDNSRHSTEEAFWIHQYQKAKVIIEDFYQERKRIQEAVQQQKSQLEQEYKERIQAPSRHLGDRGGWAENLHCMDQYGERDRIEFDRKVDALEEKLKAVSYPRLNLLSLPVTTWTEEILKTYVRQYDPRVDETCLFYVSRYKYTQRATENLGFAKVLHIEIRSKFISKHTGAGFAMWFESDSFHTILNNKGNLCSTFFSNLTPHIPAFPTNSGTSPLEDYLGTVFKPVTTSGAPEFDRIYSVFDAPLSWKPTQSSLEKLRLVWESIPAEQNMFDIDPLISKYAPPGLFKLSNNFLSLPLLPESTDEQSGSNKGDQSTPVDPPQSDEATAVAPLISPPSPQPKEQNEPGSGQRKRGRSTITMEVIPPCEESRENEIKGDASPEKVEPTNTSASSLKRRRGSKRQKKR